jgi:sterol desaturase/sphingolipid hydroxylase (fatty acid hydroxylase superfamily)
MSYTTEILKSFSWYVGNIYSVLNMWQETVLWLLGGVCVFWVFYRRTENLCNLNLRPSRENWRIDIYFLFFQPIILNILNYALLFLTTLWIIKGEFTAQAFVDFANFGNRQGIFYGLPVWSQIIIYFLLADLYLYWVHRFLHQSKFWAVHAIHHVIKQIEWWHSSRFHPLNMMVSFLCADLIMILLGIPPIVIVAMAAFNRGHSWFVHSNLNWDFGRYGKYLLSSPVFHRWHHTHIHEGGMKNFAPTFPFIDVLFGTFYMPEGKLPQIYGTDDVLPDTVVGQLLHPFKKERKSS